MKNLLIDFIPFNKDWPILSHERLMPSLQYAHDYVVNLLDLPSNTMFEIFEWVSSDELVSREHIKGQGQ